VKSKPARGLGTGSGKFPKFDVPQASAADSLLSNQDLKDLVVRFGNKQSKERQRPSIFFNDTGAM
jgi:hypothetical protein